MALPAKGTAWPPTDPSVRCALDDWSAWYSANPDKIAYRYLRRTTTTGQYPARPLNRPSQFRGGIVGGISRMFWGEPTPMGEKRTKLHVPLAKDLARTSSDLLFSEPPALRVENTATQQRLDDLMENGLKKTLIAAGEVTAALGGSYLRIVWDDRISERPWISLVHADCAAPEFLYERLLAVTFWTVLASDGEKVVRHLERYEPGLILHGVYEGTTDNLGKPVDMAAFPETAGLQPARQLPIGRRLAVSYIPNTMTAPDWNDIPGVRGLGASDLQGAEPLLDAADETMTSWMRDIRLARARIIVPAGFLQNNGPGGGMSWEDREVFAAMNIPPTEGQTITANQFVIRWAEHKNTLDDITERVVRNAGYSPGTFGDDTEGSAATATEIKARSARSMSTRGRKTELGTPGLSDITETFLMLEASGLFPTVRGVEVERPAVRWQDSVQDDIKTLAETAALLRQAEAVSTETLVALVHPDWDGDDQKAEVRRILAESGRAVSDPTQTGAEGGGHAGFPSHGGGSGQAGR